MYQDRLMSSPDKEVTKCLEQVRVIESILEELEEEHLQSGEWPPELDAFLQNVLEFKAAEKDLYEAALGESSGKGRIKEYLSQHQGEVVTSEELSRVSGIKEFARRVRELRNERGFVIDSTRTRADLGPHEYVFVEIREQQEKSRIDGATRNEYLKENPACEHCGFNPQEHNDVVGEKRYLEVDHIKPYSDFKSPKKANSFNNLQTLCNVCHRSKGTADNMWNQRNDEDE